MFNYLKARGKMLIKGKFEDAEAIEAKMTKYKNKNLEFLRTPSYAFVTMNSEKAKQAILNDKILVPGGRLALDSAPEVSDLNYENLEVTDG